MKTLTCDVSWKENYPIVADLNRGLNFLFSFKYN